MVTKSQLVHLNLPVKITSRPEVQEYSVIVYFVHDGPPAADLYHIAETFGIEMMSDTPSPAMVEHGNVFVGISNEKYVLYINTGSDSSANALFTNLKNGILEHADSLKGKTVLIPLTANGFSEFSLHTFNVVSRALNYLHRPIFALSNIKFILMPSLSSDGEMLMKQIYETHSVDKSEYIIPDSAIDSDANVPDPLHNEVLQFLLSYRAKNKNFTFWLREKNNQNRLNKGLWFPGTERYATVGLFSARAGNRSTRSVSLVFFYHKNRIRANLEVLFKNERDEHLIAFYNEILVHIFVRFGSSLHRGPNNFSWLEFSPEDTFAEVERFLEEFITLMYTRVLERGLKKIIITEAEFERKLATTMTLSDRLLRGDSSLFDSGPEAVMEEDEDEEKDYEARYVGNDLKKVVLDNDNAFAPEDHLGFKEDVRAFAAVMALKEVKPPLAVAVFGRWGSGKSFFMHHLQKTIDNLSRHQSFEPMSPVEDSSTSEEAPFCKGIVQIEFNAWSYLDSNLWAGLVSTIFEKLDEYISENSRSKDQKKALQEKLAKDLTIVSLEHERLVTQKEELETEEERLTAEIAKKKEAKRDIISKVTANNYEAIRGKVVIELNPLFNTVGERLAAYGFTYGNVKIFNPADLLRETKSWISFVQNVLKAKNIIDIGLWIAILVGIVFLITNPTKWLTIGIVKFLENNAALVLVGSVVSKVGVAFDRLQKLYQPLIELKTRFNEQMAAELHKHEEQVKLMETKLTVTIAELKDAEQQLAVVSEKKQYADYALKHSVTKRAFFEFISNKTKSESYERHLGIISTIRRDFQTLSDLFREATEEEQRQIQEEKTTNVNSTDKKIVVGELRDKKFIDKPLDRIILYIDDLDRCSDDKVMEVLQAVHLLMAFPLFMVVVGVDKRCVQNALKHKALAEYSVIQKDSLAVELVGRIDPIKSDEYLEKIFQIPFHLASPENDGMQRMVESLLERQIKIRRQSTGDHPTDAYGGSERSTMLAGERQDGRKSATLSSVKPTQPGHLVPADLEISKEEYDALRDIIAMLTPSPRTIKRYLNMYRIIRVHELLSYKERDQLESFTSIMFILALHSCRFREESKKLLAIFSTGGAYTVNEIVTTVHVPEISAILQHHSLKSIGDVRLTEIKKYSKLVQRFSFNGDTHDQVAGPSNASATLN